ncbi:hypothetical protein [Stratiformator vulcanicus]|uniref:Uncharacterized protein n=1 Tax=Stratiformator vulcanicus TaxID=2527980 RepID=A0A517QZJ9_9PLAN|nr:hypothetical protein [Stratiformator vulcanicus]QDT37075.1 hypothetical protein Pan189_14420 [Stratiformator vulcanicus]
MKATLANGIIVLSVIALASDSATAQKPLVEPNDGTAPKIERAAEQASTTFLKQHHPELARLLVALESRDRSAYQSAISDVDKARRRLERLEDRQPEYWQNQLEKWKIDSRIRLLLARLTMITGDVSVSPTEREELARLLKQRRENRLQTLEYQEKQTVERLRRLEQQVENAANEVGDTAGLEREVDSVLRSVAKKRSNSGSKEKSKKKSKAGRVVDASPKTGPAGD